MRILKRSASSRLSPVTAISTILALAATCVGVATAAPTVSPRPPAPTVNAISPPTVTATPIARVPNTLRPGHVVRSSTLSHRVFVDNTHGFALADVSGAQYPAATVNSGRTWRVNGPALHLNAAQAPLVVCEVGALNRRSYWAEGCGGQVVDTTDDGGRHWWRSLFEGGVLSVVSSGGRLLVFLESFTSGSTSVTIQVYASTDKGRSWQLDSGL
ncbi:MAG: hypothetical protein ACYDHN_08605 [Solirubrobacteraceae bacterium]